ncbi:MAG: DUF4301 family protein [Deltaproteobacteria bacterium]|nr:MAG: DUF4301 family protein [Deltaproteobacteria bacterium]
MALTEPQPSAFQQHLARLRREPPCVRLDRPCTLGDGIDPSPSGPIPLTDRVGKRLSFFIPASGAATRMFGALLEVDPQRAPTLEHLRRAAAERRSSLGPALRAIEHWSALALTKAQLLPEPTADLASWLRALRASDLPQTPKALLPFHLVEGQPSSPLLSHLIDALALLGPSPLTLHLSCTHKHLDSLNHELDRLIAQLQAAEQVRANLIPQDPTTDLPAVELDGRPVKVGGRYMLRPGGHGALLRSLPPADLLLIRNIDNAAHPDHLATLRPYRSGLVQAMIELEAEHRAHFERARSGVGSPEARAWLQRFGLSGPPDPQAVVRDLLRPLRVCGVVPNRGQPGGGPFWVEGPDGRLTPQIVEGCEIDLDDEAQREIARSASHFNPVDMVCSLRDPLGRPYALSSFVDDRRWLLSTKVHQGRPIRCLEYPGLWNGSMSGWITRFVEVPAETFNPVKTLADLLSPLHQART